jgi:hypothetical protein
MKYKDFHKVFGNRNNNYIQSFIYTFAKQAINN